MIENGVNEIALRCYADVREAPMPTEPPVGMTELPSEDVITPLSLATKCASLPIDEAEHDPECAAVLASPQDQGGIGEIRRTIIKVRKRRMILSKRCQGL